jgi:hypothetical protein|tara:strand:+ start:33 stop:269 length:237 start_codon:yes stop_codon:yes gene_type:complete
MKNPIITVINGKLCINGITFEHTELRESKQYLQSIGADEALFYPEDDDMIDELHSVIIKMGELTPEASDEEIETFYLN